MSHKYIDSVKIVIADKEGVRATLERNHNHEWQVSGVIYPVLIRLMEYIDNIALDRKANK